MPLGRCTVRYEKSSSFMDSIDPIVQSPITTESAFQAASEVSRGIGRWDVLRKRVDVLTVRRWVGDDHSIIVKLWNRPGLKGWLRRTSRTAPVVREAAALRRLEGSDSPVPKLLGRFRLDQPRHSHTDGLVIEDLHPCELGFNVLKACAAEGVDHRVQEMNQKITDLTEHLLASSILDTDHRLTNMVVTSEGRWYRIDFEHARFVRRTERHPQWLGEMLGRLLATHIFAVQPELTYVDDFAHRIAPLVNSSPRVRNCVEAIVVQMLETQRQTMGVDTRYTFSW